MKIDDWRSGSGKGSLELFGKKQYKTIRSPA
jgi:hypothetical protein